MSCVASGRVDPRALLRSVRRAEGADSARSIGRGAAMSVIALAGLGAFGAVVVKAQEDAGVLAFIRQQTRPIAEARPFYPSTWGRSVERPVPRPQNLATAYAPAIPQSVQIRIAPPDPRSLQPFHPTTRIPSPPRRTAALDSGAPAQARGTGVAYCVRTCDGFFFPLGPSTGSAAADEAACASLCPTTETRVYTRRIGDEMEAARSRRTAAPIPLCRPPSRIGTATRRPAPARARVMASRPSILPVTTRRCASATPS